MTTRSDLYKEDLLNLILVGTDFTDFTHLDFWDEDGSKKKKAKAAVKNLRQQTNGYIQITNEKDEIRKRKIEIEKRIAKSKSLDDELTELKNRFYTISTNPDKQKRGYELEPFLSDLFLLYDLGSERFI